MSLVCFRCTGEVEVDELELSDGVSGSAGSKGKSGGSLENVSSHLLMEVWPFVCVVVAGVLDIWWKERLTPGCLRVDDSSASFPKQQHAMAWP